MQHLQNEPSTKPKPPKGKVILIGAGPGAADLITMRGLRYIKQADYVFHDALVSSELLEFVHHKAKKVAVGKRCGKKSTAQTFINKQLVQAAKHHSLVVRLKGGDPMVFGRADEEIRALQDAGIEVEVVPGVTAALAAASSLQSSLTLRGVARSLTLMTPSVGKGETPNTELPQTLIDQSGTSAVYMGLRQAGNWAQTLLNAGQAGDIPVILCESVSTPQERFTALRLFDLPSFVTQNLTDGPCLILLGKALETACTALETQTADTIIDVPPLGMSRVA